MFSGDFSYPFVIYEEDLLTIVKVPKIVETTSGSNIRIRGGSIALLALLESGDLDYAFEYESVIKQHGLEIVNLPEELNLGSDAFKGYYSQVMVELDFQRFSSVEPVFRGDKIAYGFTIPSNAPHPGEAERFIAFLLSPEGREIMALNYHPLYSPSICENSLSIPPALQVFCMQGEVK
jgi:molybdate/tungstate transport system substrate-binding protein